MEQPVVSIEAYVWGALPNQFAIFIDVKEDECIAFCDRRIFIKGQNYNWDTSKSNRRAGDDAARSLSNRHCVWCHVGNLLSDGTFVYTQEL